MFYIKENGIITKFSNKSFDNAIYTDENIIRGYDHKFYLESETQSEAYKQAKAKNEVKINKIKQIAEKKSRLNELTKDLAQVQAGLVIDNIEDKKAEFRKLLNEVRVLQGKEPRKEV